MSNKNNSVPKNTNNQPKPTTQTKLPANKPNYPLRRSQEDGFTR